MSVTFTNTRIAYIKNAANKCDYGTIQASPSGTTNFNYLQNTGWHVIPNQVFRDVMTVKDWNILVNTHRYFIPKSLHVTVQNLIPLTDDLSIAQDTTFMSFNNTIYALTYQDNIYETQPQQFQTTQPYYREGIAYASATSVVKQYLPIYIHRLPAISSTTALVAGFWDPLVHAHQLGELRPGKNAIEFGWTRNATDNDKWYTTDTFLATTPSADTGDAAYYDDIRTFNWVDEVVTPGEIWKQDPENPQLQKKMISEYKYLWKYPIPNMFIKMVPIFNTKNALMKHEGQIVITFKMTFEVRTDKTANNMILANAHYADATKFFRGVGAPNLQDFTFPYRVPSHIGQPPFRKHLETEDKAIPTPAPSNVDSL